MSGQHRATEQQWAVLEHHANSVGHLCILELRARVEALEAAHRQSAMAELRAASAEARPADGGLVERVAAVFLTKTFTADDPVGARAAIREMAAAAKDLRFTTAKALIAWLEREADYG